MSQVNRLKWGLLGTAAINQRMIPFIKNLPRSTLYAVASRELAKAVSCARQWNIEKALPNYEALVSDPDVQVIYNSLPNHLHYVWTKKALEHGKHVLCEKPITLEANQVLELTALAQKNNLQLSEGFMYRHHFQTLKIKELVKSQTLGRLNHIRANFFSVLPVTDKIRLDPNLGGGVEWDIGCYLINLILYLTGEEPVEVEAWVKPGITGVNEIFSGNMRFREGLTASFSCGFLGPRKEGLELNFDKGWVHVPRPFKPTQREELTGALERQSETWVIEDALSPYERELHDFESAILDQHEPLLTLNESHATVRTLQRLLERAQHSTVKD